MSQSIKHETLEKIQELVEKEGWRMSTNEVNIRNTPLTGDNFVFRNEQLLTLEFYKSEILANDTR